MCHIYDPTAGTGDMLTVTAEHLEAHNPKAGPVMYGQELNPESYALCKADLLIKEQDIANIIFGNRLAADGLTGGHFDDMLSNPPSAWSGRRSSARYARKQRSWATAAASAPACRA